MEGGARNGTGQVGLERKEEQTRTEGHCDSDYRKEATTIINTDAAWDKQSKKAGLGWTIKRYDGKQIATDSGERRKTRSSTMAEALACLKVLKHARALNRNKVKVSSDSLNLIRALSKKEYLTELYGVLNDIEGIVKEFDFICFNFILRKVNLEADSIAKRSLLDCSALSPIGADACIAG